MNKNTASQKVTFFAFDATTNLPKSGDSANITAYVSKDDGAVTVLGDTTATEQEATNAKGYYVFDLTQAETNADKLTFSAKSGTANVVVIAVPAVVYTRPVNASAMSIDGNGRVDVIKIAGTTQTARDIGASVLLSAGVGTGQLDFTSGVVKANVTQYGGTNGTFASGRAEVNVSHFGGTAGTFAAGRPEVNLTHVKGTVAPSVTGGGYLDVSVAKWGAADVSLDGTGTYPVVTLQPAETPLAHSGTAQATGNDSTHIKLAAGASATTDKYKGQRIKLYSGTGSPAARVITAYDGTTKIATLDWALDTTADNTTKYAIDYADAPKLDSSLQVTAASVTGAVGSVTGNVGGNVVGSVNNVTAAVTVGTNNDKTGYSLVQAFPANFSSLGINASGHVSRVVLCDTLTTYTGNTVQTGDSFARLGAPAGASISADVAAVKSDSGILTGRLTGTRAGNLDFLTGDAFARLQTYRLDQLFLNDVGTPGAGSLIGDLTEDNSGTRRFTVASLVNAPAGGGGGGSLTADQNTKLTEIWENVQG